MFRRSSCRSLLPFTILLATTLGSSVALPVSADPITVGTQGNEPLIAVAPDRTIVISALQYLYASSDGGQSFFPVARPPFASELNLASDSSINFDPEGRLYFTFDWPYAGATAVCTTDSPIGPSPIWESDPSALPGGTDRMWVVAPSTDAAYAVTNEGLYETTFLTSTDRGATWSPTGFAPGLFEPQTGPLLGAPDHTHVFQVTKNGGELGFYVYSPSAPPGQVLGEYRGTGAPAPLALPSGAFGTDGSLWTTTESDNGAGGRQVIVLRSADLGLSWVTLPPVPGTTSGTSIFTWVAAGAPGHVGVLFYWTPSNGDPGTMTGATWDVLWAESFDAGAASPHWNVITLESGIRTGAICIAADCTGSNRFAGDFISSTFDRDGVAHLTWMKDVPRSIRYQRIAGAPLGVGTPVHPPQSWLGRAVPNPSHAGAAFRFSLARAGDASLALYDPAGRRVRDLVSDRLPAGLHEVHWDGRDARGELVPSGLYFVRLTIDGVVLQGTVVALR